MTDRRVITQQAYREIGRDVGTVQLPESPSSRTKQKKPGLLVRGFLFTNFLEENVPIRRL